MLKKYTIPIITTFLIIFNIVVFKFPKEIIESSITGLNIWYKSLVPSLLPFIFVNNLARDTGVFHFLGNIVCAPLSKTLKISNISAISYISALFSGYPIGSKLASDNFENGYITKEEARKVAFFTNIPSPLFTIGTVGVTLFNNKTLGLYLLAIQIASSFLLGLLISKGSISNSTPRNLPYIYKPFNQVLSSCITNTISTITIIGVYVVLLSVLIKFFTILGLLQLFSTILCAILTPIGLEEVLANGIVIGFFEMTSGLVYISQQNTIDILNVSISSFILAFGGLSINSQCISFLDKIGMTFSSFLLSKFIQGVIAFTITILTFNYIKF